MLFSPLTVSATSLILTATIQLSNRRRVSIAQVHQSAEITLMTVDGNCFYSTTLLAEVRHYFFN